MTEHQAQPSSKDVLVISPSDLDEVEVTALWSYLPRRDQVVDVQAWSNAAASAFIRDRQLESRQALAQVQAVLSDAVQQPSLLENSLRFLFMGDPEWGGVLWDVLLARPAGAWAATGRQLLGVARAGAVGSYLTEFTLNEVSGLQSVQTKAVQGEHARVIRALAGLAVRRSFGPLGECDLVALATSVDLAALSMSLEPMQELLCSRSLVTLVCGEV